ncbi:MAG: hypothetical protein C0403_04895 [Desulfobacterium sp.]|nr:hypothetical protein [Desulfobacterium sp.]
MLDFLSFKRKSLIDKDTPEAPFYLVADDLFVERDGHEVFLKLIHSTSKDIKPLGAVVLAPGIATNANIFRIDDKGETLSLKHNRSFANLLAAEGFRVYLYHPGYTERVHNRYVSRHCSKSLHFGKNYQVSSGFGYMDIVNLEVPMVVNFICEQEKTKNLSWIGYSMGSMIVYSHLSKNMNSPIKNLISIASPMALNHMFIRFIPFLNITSRFLGFEETSLLGSFSESLVPLTRIIRTLPDWFVRFNLISPMLFNPLNIRNNTIKTMLGKIIEPIPAELERFFAEFVKRGFSTHEKFANYLINLRALRKTKRNFLFFYGSNDLIATPESIFLAREVISPFDVNNLIGIPHAGHIDLIVGKNAMDTVWKPALNWLKNLHV